MVERRQNSIFRKVDSLVDAILEEPSIAKSIEKDVKELRDQTVSGGKDRPDSYGDTTFRRSKTRRSKDRRTKFTLEATDPGDPDSVTTLGFALSIGVVQNEYPPNGIKTLEVRFSYGDPTLQIPASEDINPELFCHIFADDTGIGVEHIPDPRTLPNLSEKELNLVHELTTTFLDLFNR